MKILNKLKWYPLILVLCFSFATVNRFINFFYTSTIYILLILHIIGSGLYGFANALVYGFNGNIKGILK